MMEIYVLIPMFMRNVQTFRESNGSNEVMFYENIKRVLTQRGEGSVLENDEKTIKLRLGLSIRAIFRAENPIS